MNSFDEELDSIFGKDGEVVMEGVRKAVESYTSVECKHKNVTRYSSRKRVCDDCGEEISNEKKCRHDFLPADAKTRMKCCKKCGKEEEEYDFSPEWHYYGSNGKDPSRCHRTSTHTNSIASTFEKNDIVVPRVILETVETKFQEIVGKGATRSQKRVGIIAACLYQTYWEMGEVRTTEYICKLFNIEAKDISCGMQKYYSIFPESRTRQVRPIHLVKWIMTLVGIDQSHYRAISLLVKYFENTSEVFKRGNPQSVASAIIYFYLCINRNYMEKLGMNKKLFAEKAPPSSITITKLVKEAARISRTIITA